MTDTQKTDFINELKHDSIFRENVNDCLKIDMIHVDTIDLTMPKEDKPKPFDKFDWDKVNVCIDKVIDSVDFELIIRFVNLCKAKVFNGTKYNQDMYEDYDTWYNSPVYNNEDTLKDYLLNNLIDAFKSLEQYKTYSNYDDGYRYSIGSVFMIDVFYTPESDTYDAHATFNIAEGSTF